MSSYQIFDLFMTTGQIVCCVAIELLIVLSVMGAIGAFACFISQKKGWVESVKCLFSSVFLSLLAFLLFTLLVLVFSFEPVSGTVSLLIFLTVIVISVFRKKVFKIISWT